jgi:uncharacterized membrane protein YfcA
MQLVDKAKSAFSSVMAWAKTIPSEPNGSGSSSRVIALMTAATLMGLMIAFFHARHDLPTPGQLYGIASILGTGIGAYMANKLHKHDDGDDDQPDPPQGGADASHQ